MGQILNRVSNFWSGQLNREGKNSLIFVSMGLGFREVGLTPHPFFVGVPSSRWETTAAQVNTR